MKHNSTLPSGQQPIDPALLPLVQILCDHMQMLRAWWEHFENSVREVDQAAAVKAYDLMVEGVIAARQLARHLGFVLPDVAGLTWDVAPRQASPTVEL